MIDLPRVISKNPILSTDMNGSLIYKKGRIFYRQTNSQNQYCVCKMPISKKKYIFSHFRLLERLFRISPRCAISLGNGEFLLSCSGAIFCVNVIFRTIRLEMKLRPGMNNPLSFTRLDNGSIVFGEYFSNNEHEPVAIFERKNGYWKKVFEFPDNTVYHIHGIVPNGNEVYILTGDKDIESGIWRTDNEFKTITKLVGGAQKYRSCVAFPYRNGLIYATDTPLEQNHLFFLHPGENGIWEEQSLYEMPGPCIYGVQRQGKYYFSTSVEPDALYEDTFRYKITYQLGKGVLDRFSHIVCCSDDGKIEEVLRLKKDCWPMLLFQFGNCLFAEGTKNQELVINPISLKKYDGKSIIL